MKGRLEEAVKLSGLLEKFPEIDLPNSKVGIWNKAAELTAVLREKDRVEIYRPLIADPKEVRRKRAEEGKAMNISRPWTNPYSRPIAKLSSASPK